MSNIKIILKMYREIYSLEKRVLPAITAESVVASAKPFVNILFSAKIIDLLSGGADFKTVLTYILLAVAINFAVFFLDSYLKEYTQNLRQLLLNKENQKISEKLFSTEYQKLEDSEFKELLHKHEEAEKSRWARFPYFVWTTFRFLNGLFTLAISVVIIMPLIKIGFTKTGDSFFERPAFLLAIISAILAMAVIILLVAVNINKSYLKANESYARLDRIFYSFLDIFGDYRTGKEIRLYKEQNLIDSIATTKILTQGEKTLRKISMHTARASSFVAVLGALVGFGVYLFIGIKGLYGLFSIGSLVLYCGAFMQIINGIMMMANTFGKLQEIIPLAKCYFEILYSTGDMTYGDKKLDLSGKFEIEFKNVSFKYPHSSKYALKNISLKINDGEHLAVVGRNGSGKTTFIKLLCRFYDVTDGEILINGINIKKYDKSGIAKLYSVVFQDFNMFSTTLAQNISAAESYDKDSLYSSLDKANIKDRVLAMEKRENTFLYKDLDNSGVEISGGEAQKLALARALYKDAPFVILDEPTAALDPIAENEIYSRFNSFVERKTAVYISHRLSSCAFCDRIAVFDNATLAETGSHSELIEKNGKYAELWNAQAKYYLKF
ncbi:MAG: ABC transporter ATP-binding protein/permease [Clostridiales bacterium]|nr:ABC transporter ATP-binding protein/permease [Clostridiales bacterium]